MATGNIPVLGGGSVDAKDLAIAAANGGLTIFETDKDIYVTAVTEQTLNQRILREYSNITNANTFLTNNPTGITGAVQFAGTSASGNAAFIGIPELKFDYDSTSGIGNFYLTAFGGFIATSGDISANSGTLFAGNANLSGNVSTEFLNVGNTSRFLKDVAIGNTISSTVANLAVNGNVTGNVFTANTANLSDITANNITSNNANLGNLATANFYKGAFEADSNIQPNIKSVSNTLVIGNVEVFGNANSAIIRTLDSGASGNLESLSIGVNSQADAANYYITINNKGNITLPTANTGTAVLKTAAGVDVVFEAGSSNVKLHSNGFTDLSNTAVANFFKGRFELNSNAQPNITSVGNLTGLQIGNTSANGDLTVYGVVTANTSVLSNIIGNTTSNIFGNVANLANLFVTGNANVVKLNANDALITGNTTITGNLYVAGNTSYINVENLNVEDPIISMGGGSNGNASTSDGDRGLWLRTQTADKFIGWKEADDEFVVADNASVTGTTVTINTYGNIKANVFIGNIQGAVAGNLVSGDTSVNLVANGNVIMSSNGNSTMTITTTGANITGTANVTGNLSAANAGLGNLVTANNFTGNLINGNSNIIITNNGNVSVSSTAVANVLVITGTGANITGTANVTGNIIAPNFVGQLANGSQSNINIPAADGNIEFSAAGATTFKVTGTGANVIGNADVSGNLSAGNLIGTLTTLGGNSSVVVGANSDVTITSKGNASLIVSDYTTTAYGNLVVTDTLATANFTITGDFAVGNLSQATANLHANNASFNLINNTATIVNFAGAATTLNMGATAGVLTINNPTVVGSQTTQSLFNTVATTLNIGGAATAVSIGNTSGTTTVNNDLSVNGGNILSNQTTMNIANTTATTLNIGGAATAINMGATTGTLTVNNPVVVGTQTTQNLWNTVATTVNLGGAADINLSTTGKTTTVAGNLSISGVTTISDDGNLNILGGDANGQYLKLSNFSNGKSMWANVNWSDLDTGGLTRGPVTITLGQEATAGTSGIAIGANSKAGGTGVSIGKNAGSNTLPDGSIEINGSTTAATSSNINPGFFVKPVRNATGETVTGSLVYNVTSGEIGYSTSGATSADFATRASLLALSGNVLSNVTIEAAAGNVTINSNGSPTIKVSNTAVTVTGALSVTGANLFANSATSANLGNAVTANFFIGSGANLSAIAGANVTGTVANATVATSANAVAAGNITGTTLATSVVTSSLTTVGNVTVGTWSANVGEVDGYKLSNITAANLTGNVNDKIVVVGTNNGVGIADTANVGTVEIVINGTTYTLYAVAKP